MIGGATLDSDPEDGAPVTADPDDDIFMRVAHTANAFVVSGDSDLLDASDGEESRFSPHGPSSIGLGVMPEGI